MHNHQMTIAAPARSRQLPVAREINACVAQISAPRVFGVVATPMHFSRGAEIYGQDEEAGSIYRVVSGVVRSCKLLADGRRQISAFYFAGDVFGLEIGADDTHSFAAEAVCDTRVVAVERAAVEMQAARDREIASALMRHTGQALARAQDRMVSLGRSSASERIASFLVEMARHSERAGQIELAMSREDIADYLGLTIETVSRMLSALDQRGTISLVSARRIAIGDAVGLEFASELAA